MPVCFFNNNYKEKYNCTYELDQDCITVHAEYDIHDEVEPVNGIISIGPNTEYQNRDILVIDYEQRKNLLVKDASYTKSNTVFGTPDGGSTTSFRSLTFFEYHDYQVLSELPKTPKTRTIRVFCESFFNWFPNSSLSAINNDDIYQLSLHRKTTPIEVEIDKNNLKKLSFDSTWTSSKNQKNISIIFSGYIDLCLSRKISYEEVGDYVRELQLYLQLYYPNKERLSKIQIDLDGSFVSFHFPSIQTEHTLSSVRPTVDDPLPSFLQKCYESIPYRKSKTEIRNIPYIVLRTSRGIEDNFLMFYRFIECYYKKQPIPDIKKTFVSYSLQEHYATKHSLPLDDIARYAQEIICLRNHYVHSGYYLRNSCLKISFGRGDSRNYTVNNVDVEWIYKRTKMLYDIVIDIIFSCMLSYNTYNYEKHL